MAITDTLNPPITVKEAMALWGLSKRTVYWAIWRDEVKARQCQLSRSWILDFESCLLHWGRIKDEDLAIRIGEDWNVN